MKTKKAFTSIVLGLSLCLTACRPELDLSPVGTVAAITFYNTSRDAEAAVTAAYSVLRTVYDAENIVTPTTVAADDGVPFLTGNADRRALWSYNLVSTNTFSLSVWQVAYQGIQRSNVVLARVPGIEMDETLKKRYLAEAKFLRALHYFNLVRFFGALPLITTETTSLGDVQVPRSPVEQVYALIESDLKEAEEVLPRTYTGANVGRATQGAAKGLLAKVYLTLAGNVAASPYWAQAAAKAKEVIDLGIYDLWANYADVYEIRNRNGRESIFEVVYLTDVAGNTQSTHWAPRGLPLVPANGYGTIRPTQSLWASFSAQDRRRPVSFLTAYTNPANQQLVTLSISTTDPALAIANWKLADLTSRILGGGGKSFPYMRFSDILLIYAEALSEVSNGPTAEAYTAINRVRTRAGLPALQNLTRSQFKDAILLERRVEFSFEGHRWFDLARTERLLDAVNAETSFGRSPTIRPTNVLLPIPQREVDANPALTQNPGY